MKTRNLYWLIVAIAVAVVTITLAGFIVVLVPNDPSTAALSMQHEVLEPKLEAIAETYGWVK